MNRSNPSCSDAAMVGKINQIFYDVEAERYDARHPEVIEGDAAWWATRGLDLIATLRTAVGSGAGLAILDLGCGTGFVSGLLAAHLAAGDLLVGVDQSAGMLARAAAKLSGPSAARCRLTRGDATRLQFRDRSFHLVTVNSLLHHVHDYRAVLREIDRVLKPGGYVVLAHEPNRDFFRSPLVRLAASAWKLLGFGMKVPPDLSAKINARLRESALATSDIPPNDILRLVEYHSPVEQARIAVDPSKGFSPRDLFTRELSDYAVIELSEYSTYFRRPLLERHPTLMRVARAAAVLLNGSGNLFSAVLRKRSPDERRAVGLPCH